MDPSFEKVYMLRIYPIIDVLGILWEKHGFEWLEEISGGLSCVDTTGIKVTDYKEFHSLTGEEQYAFACWLKTRRQTKAEGIPSGELTSRSNEGRKEKPNQER